MPVPPSLRPLPRDRFDYRHALHLLNRAGFGGTPAQARALADLGLDAAVDHLLNVDALPYRDVALTDFDRSIMQPPTPEQREALRRARESGDEAAVQRYREERQRRQRADRAQIQAMRRWWLKRMIETPRPLEEKMTLFWHGHFATGYRTIEDSYHMFLQNQLFRRYALGNFAELTRWIIRDPAMIEYLDNNENRVRAPNENLARELMELFTMGEGRGYTEHDIKEGARALTGYTFEDDAFRFDERVHDPGVKRILGVSGPMDGDDFVAAVFRRPEPAGFIALKLYRFFVNDLPGDPPPDARRVVLDLADLFRDADHELKPMLGALFRSRHFYEDANRAAVVKSPIQLIVQAIRSLRTPTRDLDALAAAADLMGQNLFQPPSVKGWEGGRAWINTSTLFVRQNLLVYLLTGRRPDAYEWQADGSAYDPSHLIEHLTGAGAAPDAAEVVEYLLRFNLAAEPMPARVEELRSFVASHGGRIDRDMLVALLSLITAMPEYQLC